MDLSTSGVLRARFRCTQVPAARRLPSLAEDVRAGFARTPRELPPKYFYDARGAELFERICATPEYYPTRAEVGLLEAHAADLIAAAAPQAIVEFGSGSSRKADILLGACDRLGHPVDYWPFDVCAENVTAAGEELTARYRWLRVEGLVGDYLGGLEALPRPSGPTLFAFLGGTIGNFTPAESRRFLTELARLMRPGDHFLLGADRVKDAALIERAYNDAAGVTAAFNLNLLEVLNRELDADFAPAQFRHEAVYNPQEDQIEMYLVSCGRQQVRIGALDESYHFAGDERLRTEISRKFSRERLEDLVAGAGLRPRRHVEGGEQLFSLLLAQAPPV